MSGLDSIALAVAHLEERQKKDANNSNIGKSNPAILSRNSSDASASLASSSSSSAAGAVMMAVPSSSLASSPPPPPPPRALHVPPARVISTDHSLNRAVSTVNTNASVGSAAALSARSSSSSPLPPNHSHNNTNNNSNSGGSVFGYILADPIKWLQQTQDQPPIQPPAEMAQKVEPTDVLCGRGGETNHHPGNVQYRLLVKAFQPLYVSAKRRDKPLIAQCIVYSVRQLGGRFLKRANDKEWKDVGNTKAREKTSQALREGAPELRGEANAKLMIPNNNNGNANNNNNAGKQPIMMASSTTTTTTTPTPPPPPPPSQQPPQMPATAAASPHQPGQPMSFVEAQFLQALLAQQAALTRSVVTGQHHHHAHHPMHHAQAMSHHPMATAAATAAILPQQQPQQPQHQYPPRDYPHHHLPLQPAAQQQSQLLPSPPPVPPSAPIAAASTNAATTTNEEQSRKRPAVVSDGGHSSDSESIGSHGSKGAADGSSSPSYKGGPRLKRFKHRLSLETTTTTTTN